MDSGNSSTRRSRGESSVDAVASAAAEAATAAVAVAVAVATGAFFRLALDFFPMMIPIQIRLGILPGIVDAIKRKNWNTTVVRLCAVVDVVQYTRTFIRTRIAMGEPIRRNRFVPPTTTMSNGGPTRVNNASTIVYTTIYF